MRRNSKLVFISAILLLAALAARAEDIDLFAGSPSVLGTPPNVLIILDNSANWDASFNYSSPAGTPAPCSGTRFCALRDIVSSVVRGLDINVNVGLMLFGETGPGTSGAKQAYIRYAVRNMDESNRTKLAILISNLDNNQDKGNAAGYGFSMFEEIGRAHV